MLKLSKKLFKLINIRIEPGNTLNFRQLGDPVNLVLISNLNVINLNKIMPFPPKSLTS